MVSSITNQSVRFSAVAAPSPAGTQTDERINLKLLFYGIAQLINEVPDRTRSGRGKVINENKLLDHCDEGRRPVFRSVIHNVLADKYKLIQVIEEPETATRPAMTWLALTPHGERKFRQLQNSRQLKRVYSTSRRGGGGGASAVATHAFLRNGVVPQTPKNNLNRSLRAVFENAGQEVKTTQRKRTHRSVTADQKGSGSPRRVSVTVPQKSVEVPLPSSQPQPKQRVRTHTAVTAPQNNSSAERSSRRTSSPASRRVNSNSAKSRFKI